MAANPIVRPFDDESVAAAAALILGGQIAAIPTETVYGLAADATNGAAVARIYEAKGRPSFNPLIVHVVDAAAADRLILLGPVERQLAAAFWPGPLTIVGPLRPGTGIASIVTAGLDTLAVRVPAHRAMQAVLAASGKPLAAPSANASGRISPSRAAHVFASLGDQVPLILDDGPTAAGIESTIVTLAGADIHILRPGPVTAEQIASATGRHVVATPTTDRISAPGQLLSHYAPRKPVRLNVREAVPGEWLIGFGDVAGDETLSLTGDLRAAAASLFDALHRADDAPGERIAVAPIPDRGIGIAINDRLRRAAHRD